MSDNLWGDLSQLETIKTPVAILREQAAYLTDATKGILRGEVSSAGASFYDQLIISPTVIGKPVARANKFYYELDVVAPALNDYRYTILRISHELDLYPVRIQLPSNVVMECEDETNYLSSLREILSSREVRKVIAALLSQSDS